MKTITISKQEYEKLKTREELDTELLEDIAKGIKGIVAGKVKEV